MRHLWLPAIALLFLACGEGGGSTSDAGTDADSDSDTDSDADECTDDGEDHFDPAECPEIDPDDPGIRYVDIDVEESGDGMSWASAFKTVQEGLDSARCAGLSSIPDPQVWVAEGYYEIFQGCETDTVRLREDVALYGGFTGNETALDERDPWSNTTTLSGHEDQDDFQGRIYHVVTGVNDSVIDGFTITGGNANEKQFWDSDTSETDYSRRQGGGLFNEYGALQVANCVFEGNYARYTNVSYHEDTGQPCGSSDYGQGGAIFQGAGSLTIIDCEFIGNRSVDGGAIWAVGSMSIHDSTFQGNGAHGSASGGACEKGAEGSHTYGSGGAVHLDGPLEVTNSSFIENGAVDGGALNIEGGTHIENTILIGNHVSGYEDDFYNQEQYGSGGAALIHGVLTCANCVFSSNTALWGGALHLSAGSNSSFLTNCVLTDNEAHPTHGEAYATEEPCSGGAIYRESSSVSLPLTNCIVTGNTADLDAHFHGDFDVTHSLIEGGWEGDGNIDGDPLFADAENGDFSLQPGSPCIDAADGEAAPEFDIDGNPRVDDPDSPNTGIGPPWADLGAYEYQP